MQVEEGDPARGNIVAGNVGPQIPLSAHRGEGDGPLLETKGDIVAPKESQVTAPELSNAQLHGIYSRVVAGGDYNFRAARVPVPSGLSVEAWKKHLKGYPDGNLVAFIEFGWPTNTNRGAEFVSVGANHPSATQFASDIDFYIQTERAHAALAGPFDAPPFVPMQVSPLMTRPKKDSLHRRIIIDLSWPPGASINDAIQTDWYVDGAAEIRLPTIDYMEGRLRELGRGAYLYKTDLARGYRQLRVDPGDWPLLGFAHDGKYYFDLCPPFGLRTSALCMQRTSEAIAWLHGKRGYLS